MTDTIKTQHQERTEPLAVCDLMERFGAGKAAEMIGVSPTLLYTARKTNDVSKVVEVAAAGLLAQDRKRATRLMLRIDDEAKVDAIIAVLDAMAIQYVEV